MEWKTCQRPQDLAESKEEDILPFKPLSGFKTTERVIDTETPPAVSNPGGGLTGLFQKIPVFPNVSCIRTYIGL